MGCEENTAHGQRREDEPEEFEFELWQDGMMVCAVSAGDLEDARREIDHYAAVYRQDGPCEIRGPIGPYCRTIQI